MAESSGEFGKILLKFPAVPSVNIAFSGLTEPTLTQSPSSSCCHGLKLIKEFISGEFPNESV